MQFGIEKCNKITIVKGKVKPSENITLNNGEELKSLEQHRHYRYLESTRDRRLSKKLNET